VNGDREQTSLRRAADLIEEHGWVQGEYGNKRKGYCVIGALGREALPMTYHDAVVRLDAALPDTFPEKTSRFQRLVEWNDTPGRTRDEVLQLFRKAAGDEQAVEASEG